MRYTTVWIVFFSLLSFSAPAAHAGEGSPHHLTGSLSMTTDYVFRGISQSYGHPAAQGNVEYSYDLDDAASLYGGVWASSIDFHDGNEGLAETDWTAGVRYASDRWHFDGGLIYYYYPGASSGLNYDFLELQGKATYDFGSASATASLNYSPDNFGHSGTTFYPRFSINVPLPADFSLGAGVGRQMVADNAAFGVPDYTDWGASLTYAPGSWAFSLGYTGTSLGKGECPHNCGNRFMFSVTRSF